MQVRELQPDDLFQLDLQEAQQYLATYLTREQALILSENGWSFTALINDKPVGCAGILPVWQGRAMAWSYLSTAVEGRTFVRVHRAVKRFLDACYVQRIEMTVDYGHEEGYRWAEMLGFKMEAERMRAYRPDGGDCALFARVL